MTITESVRNRISEEAERSEDELIALTQALIGCRTDSQSEGNEEFPAEVNRCQHMVADRLRNIGMRIERGVTDSRYPWVSGLLPGSGGGRSVAIGHIDVVPVGDRSAWEHDPWAGEVSSGRLWGQGACDMKGGVAAGTMAVDILQRAGVELRGDVALHIVSDEEVVGSGAVAGVIPTTVRRCAQRRTDESPTHARGRRAGPLPYRNRRRRSHAGNRYRSVHAGGQAGAARVKCHRKGMKIATALQDLERDWAAHRNHPMLPPGFSTILPGVIAGGPGGGHDGQLNLISNPGTTPNYCSIEYNVWYLPDEGVVRGDSQEIEQFVSHVCALDPWLSEHPRVSPGNCGISGFRR
ncbi:MAG: M20/M25/M40 family metallo-hydrolase [Thermomicrobiales bacterium]